MQDNQPLIDYLNSVKIVNLNNIITLQQTIDMLVASIDQMKASVIQLEQQEIDSGTQINTLTTDNVLIDEIIALISNT